METRLPTADVPESAREALTADSQRNSERVGVTLFGCSQRALKACYDEYVGGSREYLVRPYVGSNRPYHQFLRLVLRGEVTAGDFADLELDPANPSSTNYWPGFVCVTESEYEKLLSMDRDTDSIHRKNGFEASKQYAALLEEFAREVSQ